MFSGIIESVQPIIAVIPRTHPGGTQIPVAGAGSGNPSFEPSSSSLSSCAICIRRPSHFDHLVPGESISVNGVCLTLEEKPPRDSLLADNEEGLWFTLGPETLQIVPWLPEKLLQYPVNLERSLKFGDRVHGHFVSGHVEGVGIILAAEQVGECRSYEIGIPPRLTHFIWTKGSLAVDGVSLTVNRVVDSDSQVRVSICVVPETLKRTNLGRLQVEAKVNIETDYLAKAVNRLALQQREQL